MPKSRHNEGARAPADTPLEERPGAARTLSGWWVKAFSALAILTTVYHLAALTVISIDPWLFLGFSLGLFWMLAFLLFPATPAGRHAVQPLDLVLCAAAVAAMAYLGAEYEGMYLRTGFEPNTADWIFALAAVVLTIEMSRRAVELGGDELRGRAIEANVVVMRCLEEEISRIEREVLRRVKLKPGFALVRTVPGIGQVLGLTILLETGTVSRFAKAGRFASYARCVDSERISNGKKKGVGNVKCGNRYLAWAFVEAAHFAVRYEPRIKRFYERKRAKTNAVVAIKAVAHKLARAVWHMLRNEEAFDIGRAFG